MTPIIFKRFFSTGLLVTLLLILALGSFGVYKFLSDPSIALLIPKGGAEWIRFDEPTILQTKPAGFYGAIFRKRFQTKTLIKQSILTVYAMRSVSVFLDGRPLLEANQITTDWKNPIKINLPENLKPGNHEITIGAINQNGPPTILAFSKNLKLYTNGKWEATLDNKEWKPVLLVNQPHYIELSRKFPMTHKALFSQLPFFILIFLLVFSWTLIWDKGPSRPLWIERLTPSVQMLRMGLLIAWGILALNNIGKLPVYVGFDQQGHWEYIRYIAETKKLPLATEGWQMFQAPLYYLISAPLYLFFSQFFLEDSLRSILRIIPLICGMAQVELSYRALRYAFPERKDLQGLGTILGGFLPMNFYISQYLGNEPLAGLLVSSVVVMTYKILLFPSKKWPYKNYLLLSLLLGLAILTKITALLLIPPILLALIYKNFMEGKPFSKVIPPIATIAGVSSLVSGWFFIRNWIELGEPLLTASMNIGWWQDPGYRTLNQIFFFGQSLTYPIYAGINGFWDSIYSTLWFDGYLSSRILYNSRPPWNYDFMISGAWLALFPTIGILIGFLLPIFYPARALKPIEVFSALCIVVYFGALLYLFLKLPIYSCAKATYTLGLIPCYAVLGSTGLNVLMRHSILRAFIFAGIACWAISAYIAYFII